MKKWKLVHVKATNSKCFDFKSKNASILKHCLSICTCVIVAHVNKFKRQRQILILILQTQNKIKKKKTINNQDGNMAKEFAILNYCVTTVYL